MIIKSRSRKEATFGQLIEYINAPGQKGKHAIFYNLKNRSHSKITEEFLQNYQHGPKRKNGNALYHEMISFSAKDSAHLTEEILNDFAFEYLERRAKGALAYAKAHFDKDNPHVHLIISANLIRSKKKLRLSQFEFKQIKKQLEIFQKKNYPLLSNSIVFENGKSRKPKRTIKESEQERRRKTQQKRSTNQKDRVFEMVIDCLCACSEKDFLTRLKSQGLKLYVRGKNFGVQDVRSGRKFRFKTLGLSQIHQESKKRWQRANFASKKIESLRIERFMKHLQKGGKKQSKSLDL